MAKTEDKLVDFEKSLAELENLIEKMESGETSLEQSLKMFEQGISLTKDCQSALEMAEQKVQQLIEKNGLQQTLPFEPDDL